MMKNIIKVAIICAALLGTSAAYAQNCDKKTEECCKKGKEKKSCCKQSSDTCKQANVKIKTEVFSVEGSCEMCKTRIENAAAIKGVKSAEWNMSNHQITIVYNPQKVDILTVHKAIANAGHKTNLVEPNMEVYKKLPACCAYLKGGASGCGHQH